MEAQQLDQAEETKERKVSHIYGSFSIGDAEFAIAVEAIQEVVNAPESYTQMPLAPDYLLGLYHLRDMVIPTVDLSKIFNLKPVEELRENRKIVIVEYGDLCVGLLFDGTGDVFNAADQQLKLFEAEAQIYSRSSLSLSLSAERHCSDLSSRPAIQILYDNAQFSSRATRLHHTVEEIAEQSMTAQI